MRAGACPPCFGHSEYFTLLGVLTQHAEGIELLNRAHVFNLFYFLTELKSRDDIVHAIITKSVIRF